MTIDPRLLCEARTEKLAVKVNDLEKVCAQLNRYVSDLMTLYPQISGRQLPERFGEHHYPRDLTERRPMTYQSRSDAPESTEPLDDAEDTDEMAADLEDSRH